MINSYKMIKSCIKVKIHVKNKEKNGIVSVEMSTFTTMVHLLKIIKRERNF